MFVLFITLFVIIEHKINFGICAKLITKHYLNTSVIYDPTWESLDTRPLPEWYDESKIGFFTHFGLYSVPSFGSEWFWYHLKDNQTAYVNFTTQNYPPGFKYPDFQNYFKAEFFNPDQYAETVRQSGAKYFVITTKHHEGYTMWNSSYSWNWNSVDTGPKINFLDKLTTAMRKVGIRVIVYFSLYDWFHPLYLYDVKNEYKTSKYVDTVMIPQLLELVNIYKPDGIWADGDWGASSDYWKSKQFIAWLFNESPIKDYVVVNDRWGTDSDCKHESFRNCQDRYKPDKKPDYKWENAFTIDKKAWGYRREATIDDLLTLKEIIINIVETVALGGNAAINAGTSREGTIPLIYTERLIKLGKWLNINGQAIYKTVPFNVSCDINKKIWYTKNKYNDNIYAFFQWPLSHHVVLNDVYPLLDAEIYLFGYKPKLEYDVNWGKITVKLPLFDRVKNFEVFTLKLIHFQ